MSTKSGVIFYLLVITKSGAHQKLKFKNLDKIWDMDFGHLGLAIFLLLHQSTSRGILHRVSWRTPVKYDLK